MMEARPIATTMAKAIDVVPGIHENMLMYAGPPVTWERMSGPMRGAMMGALIFEGKAKNGEEAEKMLASGKIELSPCHENMCTGPMAGVISPSMLVYVVENQTYGIKCFSNLNEGRGKVLRMGAYSLEVIEKLRWMESILGPPIKAALEALGGIDCLVSNAGAGNAPGEAGWRANFEQDVLGALRLVESATPFLAKSRNASIIMISSIAALEKFISAGLGWAPADGY